MEKQYCGCESTGINHDPVILRIELFCCLLARHLSEAYQGILIIIISNRNLNFQLDVIIYLSV